MIVAVIGLGAIGAQVLWQLSRLEGVEVHGFDKEYPGHPSAGVGGESRLFWNLEMAEPAYVPLIERASVAWRELEATSGQSLRDPTGVLIYGGEQDAQMQCALNSAKALGVSVEPLGTSALRRRFPNLVFDDHSFGLWDTTGAVIRPERTVEVAVELSRWNSAIIHEFCPVSAIDVTGSMVSVLSSSGKQEFDRVVICCGGWTPKLVPHIQDEVVTRRLTSLWFTTGQYDSIDLPPFLRTAPQYCYGIPSHDRRSIKLGLGFNDHYVTGDADMLPRQLEGAELAAELNKFEWIREGMLPWLSRRPYRVETYVESYTRSMLEYIRPHVENPNVIIMTGFSGHGFRVSPAIGEIGCQLVVDGKTSVDIGFMERAKPVFSILDPKHGTTTHNSVMASGPSRA